MALLNSSQPSSVYVDPRAAVLYGPGNNNITPAQIKDYITSPGRSDKDVLGAALANNVSMSQIADAMKGNPAYSQQNQEKYIASQGISDATEQNYAAIKPYKPVQYTAIEYTPISNVNAVQDPVNGTVAGQLKNNLDPNSPLMQRASAIGNSMSNKRGLLNSSIGISAAMAPMIDAGLQVATPDAASNNQFNMFNVQNQNDTNRFNAINQNDINKFNASNALSASVADAGNVKDIGINAMNQQTNMAIANLDSGTKLKIANIDALSKDSNLAASLNQSLMNAIVEINKQDKPVDVRQAEIEQLVNLTTQSIGLLQSFDSKVPALKFDDIMKTEKSSITGSGGSIGSPSTGGGTGGAISGGGTNKGATPIPGSDGKVGSYGSMVPNGNGYGYQLYTRNALRLIALDTNDYKLSVPELSNVKGYIKGLGVDIDLNDVAPQALMDEINRMQGNQTGEPNPLFFAPVYAPKAMDPSFYIYKAAVSKYQK